MSERIYTAAEARALREAATPGPWFTSGDCQTGGLDYLTVEVPIGPTENVSAAVLASIRRYGRHKNMAEGNAAILAAAPDLCLTVEALEAERDRLRAALVEAESEIERLHAVARGCHDFNGGHLDEPEHSIYHDGIDTVIRALRSDATSLQTRVLVGIGRETPNSNSPTRGEE